MKARTITMTYRSWALVDLELRRLIPVALLDTARQRSGRPERCMFVRPAALSFAAYQRAAVTAVAAFSINAATACGCDTYTA